MNNKFRLFGIIALFAVIGITMTVCDTEGPKAPAISDLKTGTYSGSTFIEETSFPKSTSDFYVQVAYTSDANLSRIVTLFKQNGEKIMDRSFLLINKTAGAGTLYGGNVSFNDLDFTIGSYTVDVWVYDYNSSKSNTLSKEFTIK